MARPPVRWLYDELPRLVERGVLDGAAAERVREHYGPAPAKADASNVLLAVFGVIGAVLIGLGVVLVLAHNWEDLSRPVRAGIAFGVLLAAQAIAAWAIVCKRESPGWIEATSAALAIAVVATVALIAQTYHLPGDLRNLLFVWAVLVAPLPYVGGSRLAAAAAWLIGAWWIAAGPWWTETPGVSGWLVPAAITAPFLVHLARRHAGEGRTALVGWAIVGSTLFALPRVAGPGDLGLWVPLFAGFLGSCLVVGERLESVGASAWSWTLRPWTSAGTIGVGFLTFLFGFRGMWEHGIADGPTAGFVETFGPWGIAWRGAAAVALVAAPAWAVVGAWRDGRKASALLLAVPVWATAGWLFAREGLAGTDVGMAIVANVAALALGVAACAGGLRHGAFGRANAGLLLIAATAVARFFDFDVSFVVRGLAFILVGIGFLAINVRVARRRRALP